MEEEYSNKILESEGIKYSPLEEIKKIVQRHKTTMALPADGNYKKLLRKMKYEDYLKSSKEK